jgi:hypothetical protein
MKIGVGALGTVGGGYGLYKSVDALLEEDETPAEYMKRIAGDPTLNDVSNKATAGDTSTTPGDTSTMTTPVSTPQGTETLSQEHQ